MPVQPQAARRRARRTRPFPLCAGILEVVAAEQLSAGMRRITFAGDGVADLPIEQPGEILTLIWPAPGTDRIVLPSLRRWRFPDGAGDQHARNVTIRALDRARAEVTVDFFLHGGHGRASGWARTATHGDGVGYGGPRAHWKTDPEADWTLLIGDETALPAIGAILEHLPAGHETIVVVEVEDRGEQRALTAAGDRAELHWVHRGDRAPGRGRALLEAVARLQLPADGRAQVWGAGESLLMRPIREHLRHQRDVPRECINVLGYWTHAS